MAWSLQEAAPCATGLRVSEIEGLTREVLPRVTVATLQSQRRRNPDVLLVRWGGGTVVVKDFAPRSWLIRRTIGRWITRREVRAYRKLAGHPAVPRFLGSIDELAFAIEHRPGERMSRRLAGTLPPGFLDALEQAVETMHARGVAHLDLRHRTNVLADAKGRPVLLDFASAVILDPNGWAGRLLLPLLRAVDRAALAKWRRRLEPSGAGTPTPAPGAAPRPPPPEGPDPPRAGAEPVARGSGGRSRA